MPARRRVPNAEDEGETNQKRRGGAYGETIFDSPQLPEGVRYGGCRRDRRGSRLRRPRLWPRGADPTAGEVKRIRSCCRACGKVECGTWVTVQDNKVIKVEGDESNAHSRGHCCAKSQSSMLALYHPDRLRYCLKRTNPKGEDDPGWVRFPWPMAFDEAGRQVQRDRGEVRRRGQLCHGRHVPRVGRSPRTAR